MAKFAYRREDEEWYIKRRRFIPHNVFPKNPKNYTRTSNFVIKITGNSNQLKNAVKHINYISRNGNIDIYDDNLEKIDKDDAKEIIKNNFNEYTPRTNSAKAKHLVFSRKTYTPKETMLKIVKNSLKSTYPNCEFLLSYHNDTKNPHVHVYFFLNDKETNKTIRIDKSSLRELMQNYDSEQKKEGYKSYYKNENSSTVEIKYKKKYKKKENKADKMYLSRLETIKDFGYANYKFDNKNSKSFYLITETSNGKKKITWSKGLAYEIEKNKISIGDLVRVKKITKEKKTNDKSDKSIKSILKWEINTLPKSGTFEVKKTNGLTILIPANKALKRVVVKDIRLLQKVKNTENGDIIKFTNALTFELVGSKKASPKKEVKTKETKETKELEL